MASDGGTGPIGNMTARGRTVKELAKQILPESVWRGLWRMKNAIATPVRVQRFMDAAGYNVAEKADYYSPMSSVPAPRFRAGSSRARSSASPTTWSG
jgi:hypothetical protein